MGKINTSVFHLEYVWAGLVDAVSESSEQLNLVCSFPVVCGYT